MKALMYICSCQTVIIYSFTVCLSVGSSLSVEMVCVGITAGLLVRPVPIVLKPNGCLKKPHPFKTQQKFVKIYGEFENSRQSMCQKPIFKIQFKHLQHWHPWEFLFFFLLFILFCLIFWYVSSFPLKFLLM